MFSNSHIAELAQSYLRTPVPDILDLRRGLDAVEAGLMEAQPDYASLYKLADAMTDTMSFRASSGEICEFILRERKDQIERILDRASHCDPSSALPIIKEFVRGAFAAVDGSRMTPRAGQLSDQISRWRYNGTSESTSIGELRELFQQVFDHVATT